MKTNTNNKAIKNATAQEETGFVLLIVLLNLHLCLPIVLPNPEVIKTLTVEKANRTITVGTYNVVLLP